MERRSVVVLTAWVMCSSWQGSAGNRRPYADLTGNSCVIGKGRVADEPEEAYL